MEMWKFFTRMKIMFRFLHQNDKPVDCSSFNENNIHGTDERNPLAVMTNNEILSLEKHLKKWITNMIFSYFYMINKSPAAGDKKAVVRYSVIIQSEKRNALSQATSGSQMLTLYDDGPPNISGGSLPVKSIKVVVYKIVPAGQDLDNRAPVVYMKVYLNVADGRACPLTDYGFCDIPLQSETHMYNNVLQPSCFIRNPIEFNQFFEFDIQIEDPRIVSKSLKELQKDNQAITTINDDNAVSGPNFAGLLKSAIFMSMIISTSGVSMAENQVILNISNDISQVNCTLQMSNGYNGDCILNNSIADSWNNFIKFIQMNDITMNLEHLLSKYKSSSGTLQLIVYWILDENFNCINSTIIYKFNSKELTNDEIANLPKPNIDTQEENLDMNPTEFANRMREYTKELWMDFKNVFLLLLKTATTSREADEPTNQGQVWWDLRTSRFMIIIICGVVIGFICLIVFLYIKYGKNIFEKIYQKVIPQVNRTYSPAGQDQTEDDPNVMQNVV